MSNQPENEMQQSETMTPDEVRQHMLAELEAGAQAISELSDEQLEQVAGGAFHLGTRTKLLAAAAGTLLVGGGIMTGLYKLQEPSREQAKQRAAANGYHA